MRRTPRDRAAPHRRHAAHGIAAPRLGVALRVRMIEVEHAALAHHRFVVEVLLQPSQSFIDSS
jgi:hypothetical protein